MALKHGWMTLTGAGVALLSLLLDAETIQPLLDAVTAGASAETLLRKALGVGFAVAVIGLRRAVTNARKEPPPASPSESAESPPASKRRRVRTLEPK